MKTDILTRLAYSNVFTQKRSVKTLLKEIDLKDALFVLSTLNRYEYKLRKKDDTELNFILNEWLLHENQELRSSIINAYAKYSEKRIIDRKINPDLKTVVLINRISTLRVIEVLCAYKTISESLNKISLAKSRENLLKLYLLINDEIADRQDVIFNRYFKKNPTYLDEIHLHLFLGITQPFQPYYKKRLLQPEVYKFLLFEKWIRESSTYSELSVQYVKRIGLNNWYQYFTHIYHLCQAVTQSNIIFLESYPVLEKLTAHLLIDTSKNPEWSEFVYLKKNPLVKLDSDRYAVLDFEFLMNKFFSSLYHDLLSFSQECGIKKFAQDYEKEFIEGTLLSNTFRTSFSNSYVQYAESDIKSVGSKGIENIGLPDYYIRNGNTVMLFECKNSFLSNANKIALNTDRLLKELEDKFYYTTNSKTGKRRGKGVLQLLDFVNNSINGKYRFFDKTKRPENLNYYPVLLVMDATLTSYGFNQLLNYYFQQELEDSIIEKKYKVKPLTIIHIDDFFVHQGRLKKLSKLIMSYHKFLKSKESFDSMISFSDYLNIFKFPKLLRPRKENVSHIIKDSLLPSE